MSSLNKKLTTSATSISTKFAKMDSRLDIRRQQYQVHELTRRIQRSNNLVREKIVRQISLANNFKAYSETNDVFYFLSFKSKFISL